MNTQAPQNRTSMHTPSSSGLFVDSLMLPLFEDPSPLSYWLCHLFMCIPQALTPRIHQNSPSRPSLFRKRFLEPMCLGLIL